MKVLARFTGICRAVSRAILMGVPRSGYRRAEKTDPADAYTTQWVAESISEN